MNEEEKKEFIHDILKAVLVVFLINLILISGYMIYFFATYDLFIYSLVISINSPYLYIINLIIVIGIILYFYKENKDDM